mgnify:CR=1 FL=1|tara:strand:- start:608 stop:1021 length:414 start_codon:yes stop_codon:yes gene_type:complete
MKKNQIDYDQEIDSFLRCENDEIAPLLDEKKLAAEIHCRSAKHPFLSRLIPFALPLAACLVLFLGLMTNYDFFSSNTSEREIVERTDDEDSIPSAGVDEMWMLDEWLLALPDNVDFASVDYDSSYELLVSLETIPLP